MIFITAITIYCLRGHVYLKLGSLFIKISINNIVIDKGLPISSCNKQKEGQGVCVRLFAKRFRQLGKFNPVIEIECIAPRLCWLDPAVPCRAIGINILYDDAFVQNGGPFVDI